MRYTAFWLTLAACCAFSAGNALAQGAGQGQHEAGSGVDNPSIEAGGGGGIGGNFSSGQGHYGPNGSGGAAISGGPNGNAVGQGQFEAGGSGGAPAYSGAPINAGAPINNRAAINPGGPMIRVAPAPRQVNRTPNDWRFVLNNGMWWYYQPDNSWAYYQNGAWQNYDEQIARMARVEHHDARAPANTKSVERR